MIPHPHRQKGGAPQLGAKGPGEPGPFGPYGADEDRVGEDDPGNAYPGNSLATDRARTTH